MGVCVSAYHHLSVQLGAFFFACPGMGLVSWDPPVGNYVYVYIMHVVAAADKGPDPLRLYPLRPPHRNSARSHMLRFQACQSRPGVMLSRALPPQ
jgi:hypothetical protein